MPHPDKKGYTDIYVDGELLLTVSDDAVIEAGLRTGKTFDEDALYETERAVNLTRAKNKAYTYLSYGDMSSKKLFDKLIRAGFDEQTALDCIDAMKNAGYIDDTRYAHALANSLACVKLYGPRRIREELRVRGISGEDADLAIEALDTDFEKSVQALINGKLRSKTEKQRISALIRYGYDYDFIRNYGEDYE